ncbi:hypothetical protein A9Q94_17000 [Rhodobacterales bacterium 56_14_T64]|nr:hypothetical protein A9Q94_17000 [Rhodobacterales bacterium 56_14_T64]
MADRIILFSAPMVQAILREIQNPGTGKTQTRRLITKEAAQDAIEVFSPGFLTLCGNRDLLLVNVIPGDRLWVKENWQALTYGDYQPTKSQPCDIRYAATDREADLAPDIRGYPWRPSIHMNRWASRLTLDVTDVRVQRCRTSAKRMR